MGNIELCLLATKGKPKRIIKNVKQIENFFIPYAKKQECSGLEIIGRKGWGRAIKKNGLKFKQTGYFYEVVT